MADFLIELVQQMLHIQLNYSIVYYFNEQKMLMNLMYLIYAEVR